jgi:hypothetical protein
VFDRRSTILFCLHKNILSDSEKYCALILNFTDNKLSL